MKNQNPTEGDKSQSGPSSDKNEDDRKKLQQRISRLPKPGSTFGAPGHEKRG